MKKVTIALCFTLFFLQIGFFAQEAPNIIPPNPEAASIAKFTETPVSYFTGIPDINVPIYEINVSGMSIPINLSYHARGIKVDEIASSVGLGWSFNYGGMISRQTRGNADDVASYYIDYNTVFTDVNYRYSTYMNMNNWEDQYDLTPDKFIFSAIGNSGNFIIDPIDKNVVMQKMDDMEITYQLENITSGRIIAFVITDKLGNKYYYGKSLDGTIAASYEQSTSYTYMEESGGYTPNPEDPNGIYFNAWMLMDVVTTNGDVVHYKYDRFYTHSYRRSYDKVNQQGFNILGFSNVTSCEYRLKEISFNSGKVLVNYLTPREDLNGAYRVDEIKLVDNSNVEIFKYNLNYEYTTSTDLGNQWSFFPQLDPQSLKRLFLKSVNRNVNTENYKYQFFYNQSHILPGRFSNKQDAWGYYNGKNNGQFLSFINDDRTVDTDYSGVGLINKIIYPTGGSIEYEFEDNFAVHDNKFNDLIIANINPVEFFENGLSNLEWETCLSNNVYTKIIHIGENIVGNIKVDINFTDDQGCSEDIFVPGCKFQVSIEHNGQITQLFKGTHYLYNNSSISGDYILRVMPLELPHDPFNMDQGFNVNFGWEEQDINQNEVLYAGGKRIKNIWLKENDNLLSLHKQYSYQDDITGVTSGVLFGLPNFYSINSTYGDLTFRDPHGSIPGSPLSNYQGNSVGYYKVTEFTMDGNNNNGKIEYEFSHTQDTGGYYEFPYTMPTDNEWLRGKLLSTKIYKNEGNGTYTKIKEIRNNYLYAGVPLNYNFIPDGLFTPESISNYLAVNVSDTNKLYFKGKKLFRLPLIIFTRLDEGYGLGIDPYDYIGYKVFYITGGTMDLDSSTEIEYLGNGQTNIHTTKYNYDYDNHYQLYSNVFSNSYNFINNELEDLPYTDNEPLESKYYYANSPQLNGLPGIQDLKDKHMLGIPLKTESYNSGEKISEVYTEYNVPNRGLCLPKYVFTKKGNEPSIPLQRKITYDLYDSKGNLNQYTLENGIPVSIIWAYNSTQPVAKIEGLAYNSIPATLITNIKNATDLPSANEAQLLSALTNLRTNASLANAMVTTLSYKPLIGVSSVTDPKGDTQYYFYDDFNRLKFVKDKDDHILSENKYHYRSIVE
jgi:hypothetical protein